MMESFHVDCHENGRKKHCNSNKFLNFRYILGNRVDLTLAPGLRSGAVQSDKGTAVFLAQDSHEGGKTFTGVASSDLIS
jgi:hypothetical protein